MLEINPAWFLLISLIGFVILAVFAYLKRQSYRLSRTLSQLYQLNQQHQQDPIEFIDQAWSIIQPMGFSGYQAQINWFGEPIEITKGSPTGKARITKIYQEDIQVEFKFYSTHLNGERLYFADLVQHTFLHLVEHNIQTKINQVLTTQAGLQRAQVFAQHDLKNIMQFIQLLTSQLQQSTSLEQEQRIINRLKDSLPSLQQRAERVLSQLQNQSTNPERERSKSLALAEFIHQLIKPLFIPYQIQGNANLFQPPGMLSEAFYNLLANFRDHNKTNALLNIEIHQQQDQIKLCLSQDIAPEQAQKLKQNKNRLFEPFWSNSESGMGIGLYIARQRVQRLGGQVYYIPSDQQACFEVVLPINTAE